MINVYVTHHVTAAIDGINDLLIDQLYRMRSEVDSVRAKLHVVYWTDSSKYDDDLRRRTPGGVELVRNDHPNRPDTQPSKRNKVVDHAKASGCEAFVLLHNDIRLGRGSLEHLVNDWHKAEKRHGRGKVVISPRYIPYHLTGPRQEAVSHPAFWTKLRSNVCVKTEGQMEEWCAPWGWRLGKKDRDVVCSKKSSTTDDGHMLMMFIAGVRFFDDVGPCNEAFTGANFDDSEWGMRALMRGKRNLQSTGALVGHLGSSGMGPTFGPLVHTEAWRNGASDNARVFINKWGQALFDEMQTGKLWIRLHREQWTEGEVR